MNHIITGGPCSQAKMSPLEIPLESNASSRSSISTSSLGDHEMVTSYKAGKRNTLSDTDDDDIEMCFQCSECLSDDNECTWLSSGSCTSASFLNSDDLQSLDILEIDVCETLLRDQFSAKLLVSRAPGLSPGLSSSSSIFNGPTVNSIEASPVPARTQDGVTEENEHVRGRFNCNDLPSNPSGSSPSLSVNGELSPSQGHDFDTTDISVSLLDLEGEESEWDKDGSDTLDPDFPSPSYRILRNIQIRSANLSFKRSSKQLLDVQTSVGSPSAIFDLSPKYISGVESPQKHSGADEPLFWPFDWKSYWRPEFEGNYLGISPRASILKINRPRGCHSPKSLQLTLHKRNGPSLHREDFQRGYREGIMITSRSAQPTLADGKTRDPHSRGSHSKVPSRLSRTSGLSSDKSESHLSKTEGKGGHHQLNSGRSKRGRDQKSSLVRYLWEFEAGELQIYLADGMPIEALVGLDEFDGHEGIGKMMRAS